MRTLSPNPTISEIANGIPIRKYEPHFVLYVILPVEVFRTKYFLAGHIVFCHFHFDRK